MKKLLCAVMCVAVIAGLVGCTCPGAAPAPKPAPAPARTCTGTARWQGLQATIRLRWIICSQEQYELKRLCPPLFSLMLRLNTPLR